MRLFLLSRSVFLRATAISTILSTVLAKPSAVAYQPNNIGPERGEQIMKAWHCHGRSQRELVDRLRQARIVKSTAVQKVMETVDRKFYVADDFVSQDTSTDAYMDMPLGIGQKQTISAPHMHAHVLEEMLPAIQRNALAAAATNDDDDDAQQQQQTATDTSAVKVLDVGCGSGYLTACLGRWFHAKEGEPSILPFPGKVFGMDIHPELVQFTKENIETDDADLLKSHTITLQHGNGWLGWPEEAPFDAIHVGAAAATFPTHLALQLSLHGVLIVPVGPQGGDQVLIKVERVAQTHGEAFSWDDFHVHQLLGVRYVPLVQRPE
mmetsp:Transcript_23351/g.64939  ORF Transcript_23351/g.64939 Transcript_23351/m.64939 type:complete len:322 (+) Transcript_23351:77-1042(+)